MKLRIRISIDLADNQIDPAITPAQLKQDYAPSLERALAGALPGGIAIDTVKVTRINVATTAPEPVQD